MQKEKLTKNRTFSTKVVLNGRITIPEVVREACGIKEGDTVEVEILTVKRVIPFKEI